MKTVDYILLDCADHPGWDAIPGLITAMYDRMNEMGLMIPLAEGGLEMWLRSAKNTTGKFGIVVLAKWDEMPVGFAHGLLKFMPDYLGNYTVGMITHVYVISEARNNGIGNELARQLESYFRQKNVHSIELQVIPGNRDAVKFWESLGYSEELIQYRKIDLR